MLLQIGWTNLCTVNICEIMKQYCFWPSSFIFWIVLNLHGGYGAILLEQDLYPNLVVNGNINENELHNFHYNLNESVADFDVC